MIREERFVGPTFIIPDYDMDIKSNFEVILVDCSIAGASIT